MSLLCGQAGSLASQFDGLDLVVDLEVERVEVANELLLREGHLWRNIIVHTRLDLRVELDPPRVELLALVRILLYPEVLLLFWLHLESLLERVRIDLFQDCLQRNQ